MLPEQTNRDRAIQLQQLIYDTIPLGKFMGLHVTQLTDDSICLEAPVTDNNINIHGTGFAGSIYSMCALSAWGIMHMRMLKENITADVVIARGEIRYLSPVKENIRCESLLEEEHYHVFHERLLREGKASLAVVVRAMEQSNLRAILEARVAIKITDS